MPIGAENIGTAYVRVIADGKDFDLGDMLRGHEGDGEMAGRRLSAAYEKGFREEWSKKPNQTRLRKAIFDAMIPADAAKMFTATRNFQNFKGGLVTEYGEIGRRAGENFEQALNTGRMDISGFTRNIQNLNRYLVQAEKELNAERKQQAQNMAEFSRSLNAAIVEDNRRRHAAEMDMLREAYQMNAQFDRQRTRQRMALIAGNHELIRTYRQLRADIELMTRGEIEHGLSVSEVAARLKDLTDSLKNSSVWNKQVESDVRRHHDALLRMHPTLNRLRSNLYTVADATGAAFGRGSRNDFLNFTGSVARNSIRLGGSLLNLLGYFNGLRNRMADAGSAMGGLNVAFRDLGRFALRGVGGLAGLFGVIGPLTSVLSGLGGMVLAVASTIGGALLGALSSLGSTLVLGLGGGAAIAATALVPLVAGIGVFTLAVMNADKETKAAFKSIGDEFSGLGEVAATSTFANIDEQARRFKAVLGDLSPLVSDIGSALSRVGDAWLDMMEGPGFAAFRSAMESFLPRAVESLGIAIGNVAGGLAGMFRAAIPQSSNFLGWIQRITGEFNAWANSIAGQQELSAFFDRAAESARELGGFLSAATGLIAEIVDQANAPGGRLFSSMTEGLKSWTDTLDRNPNIMQGWIESMESFGRFAGSARDLLLELLSAGQGVGDSLFASMSDTIDGWVRTLRANPDILRSWYDSAGSFARALGDVTVGLGKVFDALDNPFSRGLITGVFTGLAGAIELAAGALQTIASIFGQGADAAQSFAGQVAGAAFAIGLIQKSMVGGVLASMTGFVGNLRNAETRLGTLSTAARIAGGAGGLLAFSAGAETSNRTAGFLMQTLGGAGAGFALGGPWGALIGGAAGAALSIFGGKAEEAGNKSAGAAPQVADFASTLDEVTGAATAATRELALMELQKQGAVSTANSLGIATRDLVSAALGHKGASEQVWAALDRQQDKEFALAESGATLTQEQKDQSAAARDLRTALFGTNAEMERQQRAAQLAAGAIQPLSELLKDFRSSIRGELKADIRTNAPAVYSDFTRLIRQFGLVPKEVRTLIKQFGGELTEDQIKRIIGVAKELDKQRPNPKINVDKSQADARLADVRSNLDFVGRITKTPKITVDNSQALGAVATTKSALSGIPDETVWINVQRRMTGSNLGPQPAGAAAGMLTNGPQVRLIGEAGPEAVVPLARNLSQVDPSVRALSAFAQGKMTQMSMRAPVAPTKTISADGWTIVSNSTDTETVARQVFDRLAGAGY